MSQSIRGMLSVWTRTYCNTQNQIWPIWDPFKPIYTIWAGSQLSPLNKPRYKKGPQTLKPQPLAHSPELPRTAIPPSPLFSFLLKPHLPQPHPQISHLSSPFSSLFLPSRFPPFVSLGGVSTRVDQAKQGVTESTFQTWARNRDLEVGNVWDVE